MEKQEARRERLEKLMDDHRCWPTYSSHPSPKFADYDDSYAEMAEQYLGISWGDVRPIVEMRDLTDVETVPQYAATIYDETYSMIELFDSITEALSYSNGQNGEEYLTGGGSVIDLDTGQVVEKRTVILTVEAFNLAAVLLEEAWLVHGHMSPFKKELQDAFPVSREEI